MLNIYPTCTVYVKLYAWEVGSSLTQEGWVHRLMNNNNIFERNTICINPTSNIFRTYFGWIYVCALGSPQHKINISHCIFIGCNLQFSVASTLSTYMLRISKNGLHACMYVRKLFIAAMNVEVDLERLARPVHFIFFVLVFWAISDLWSVQGARSRSRRRRYFEIIIGRDSTTSIWILLVLFICVSKLNKVRRFEETVVETIC